MAYLDWIHTLRTTQNLDDEALQALLVCKDPKVLAELMKQAHAVKVEQYGTGIFLRGLIEFSNCCTQNCAYCGIQAQNKHAQRYRLSKQQILECVDEGYALGFQTFVLQGGEDPLFSDVVMADIVRTIKARYPKVAVTLSYGEKSKESYQTLFDAGADRYLLRHEAASEQVYAPLHPQMSLAARQACHTHLKEIGYQVGTGFIVGLPNQTTQDLIADIRYIQTLHPHMIGIGPFMPHHDTALAQHPAGDLQLTLTLLAILRLMFPKVLLPATTALGSLASNGRELALKAGANVIMPNLSPQEVRSKYLLYDGKVFSKDEAAQSLALIKAQVESAGSTIDMSRGDYKGWTK